MTCSGFSLILLVLAREAFAAVSETQIADKVILQRQKNVLDLLHHVYQSQATQEILGISENYKIEDNVNNYREHSSVTNLLKYYNSGLLSREAVFSVFNEKHKREAIALFDLFYFAKDYDTFYKTACWARINVNPGLFTYAFTAALSHRDDTRNLIVPAAYEINPHFFVDAEVLQKVTEVALSDRTGSEEAIVSTNTTDYLYDSMERIFPNYLRSESRMRYFTEDVFLNNYNNYYHLNNPFWMNMTEGKRGELFCYYHQQTLARYLQERYSNDLPSFDTFRIDNPIECGYNPRLRYPNGKYFTARPDNIKLDDSHGYEVKLVEDFERRVRDAIDLGYILDESGEKISIDNDLGIDHLGHLIQSTVKSKNRKFYGNLYELTVRLLGHIVDPQRFHNIAPSVLEHFETSLRDPLYYRLLAAMVQLFLRYKSHLPSYSKEILEFPGVKIVSVEVEKLVTHFQNFDVDVSNAILNSKGDDESIAKVKHYRLNHLPFSYHINVTSEKPVSAMLRAFIGVKYDSEGRTVDLNERRKFMVEIDNFPIEFQAGLNSIERKSDEISITRKEYPTMKEMYRRVEEALQGNAEYFTDVVNLQCGYPEHLLLPKGKAEGMPYSFFIAISKYNPSEFRANPYGCGYGRGLFFPDKYSMGYPFDRVIDEQQFSVPNFYEKEILIYHVNSPPKFL